MSEMEVPKGWELVKLSNIVLDSEKRNPKHMPEKEFKYVGIGGIGDDKKISQFRIILGKYSPSQARNVIRTNDVIYGTTRPYYRNVVIIPDEFDDEICSTGFCVLRPNPKKIFAKYLFYHMLSDTANNQIMKSMRGGNYPAVSNDDVTSISLLLSPLETQKKIVKKLDNILGKLEEKKKEILSRIEKFDANKINQSYKNHSLKLAFDGVLTNEEPGEIIDGVQVPKGWESVKLSNIVLDSEKRNPKHMPKKEFKYVEIGGISDDKKISKFRIILGKYSPSRARNVIRTNDVIYGTTRPYYRNVVIIPDEFDDEICSTGFCVLRPNPKKIICKISFLPYALRHCK